jgi:MATE family, multidrug efflux pump
MLGVGQAVEILVGQRLGEDRPALAERTTWTGFRVTLVFTMVVALAYLLAPGPLASLFRSSADPGRWQEVGGLIPGLLRFVAFYTLFDSVNLIFSFALRGAGDTRFVTRVGVSLSGLVLVLPTWVAWRRGWGLYAFWAFATLYLVAMAATFVARFRQGKWRAMRVIEPAHAPDDRRQQVTAQERRPAEPEGFHRPSRASS